MLLWHANRCEHACRHASRRRSPCRPVSSWPRLQAVVPSVRKVVTITEDNDPNCLIGRPNGYTDAAVIYDF
jgi:hypothetical protein